MLSSGILLFRTVIWGEHSCEGVVNTDDRHVLGNANAKILQGPHSGIGQLVGRENDGIDLLGLREHGLYSIVAGVPFIAVLPAGHIDDPGLDSGKMLPPNVGKAPKLQQVTGGGVHIDITGMSAALAVQKL